MNWRDDHNESPDAPKSRRAIRGAQYVRMSTEHQRYSTENQSDAIAQYARQRGIDIVRTYSDEGKSGLRIQGRDGLKQLFGDIQSGRADFEVVLVYDISRWGRFQDADESAYYEYTCKRAGISVIYCAEQFENDGSPVSTIVKGVKRAMAGEYSRELSQKVFTGQCRLIELGYRQGGPPGFGLRRMLIDEQGIAKGILERGEHKSIQTDRVTLVPGPTEIPAIVIDASSEDCLVMSLVENLARRQHRALDLLRDIKGLKERGYSEPEIARKTHLSLKYVRGVVRLLESGEHRLLRAVESGKIPVSVAVDIAEDRDTEVQDVLRQAYENNLLRGGKLMAAKRLVEARQQYGKGQPSADRTKRRSLSVESLIRTYQNDAEKKQVLLRKATATRNELMFITEALRKLLNDENFVTLLRAEGLATIPKNLSDRLAARLGGV